MFKKTTFEQVPLEQVQKMIEEESNKEQAVAPETIATERMEKDELRAGHFPPR